MDCINRDTLSVVSKEHLLLESSRLYFVGPSADQTSQHLQARHGLFFYLLNSEGVATRKIAIVQDSLGTPSCSRPMMIDGVMQQVEFGHYSVALAKLSGGDDVVLPALPVHDDPYLRKRTVFSVRRSRERVKAELRAAIDRGEVSESFSGVLDR